MDEQFVARRKDRELPTTITRLGEQLDKLTADAATLASHAHDPLVIAGRSYSADEEIKALARALEAVPQHVRAPTRVPLGTYHGIRLGLHLHPGQPPDLELVGQTTRDTRLSRDHHGPRAILNALDRLGSEYRVECQQLQQRLNLAQSQLQDYQSRLGNLFAHESYLDELTDLRNKLQAHLSHHAGAAPAETPVEGESLSIAAITTRMKSLKDSHTLDAAPARTASKPISAEEPVTTRIRRMQGIEPKPDDLDALLESSDSQVQQPAKSLGPAPTHSSFRNARSTNAPVPSTPLSPA